MLSPLLWSSHSNKIVFFFTLCNITVDGRGRLHWGVVRLQAMLAGSCNVAADTVLSD